MRQKNTKIILSITIGLIFVIGTTATQASYWQTSILPDVSDWPQHQNDSVNGSWCGVAVLQAKIDWDWREHHNDYTHFHTQEELWDYARDHTSSDISIKGVQGRDEVLPGVVGNGWTQVRKLNISYDFGIDPHAVAWLLWKYGPSYYHYWIYDDVDQATWALLWTLENYHEPVPTAVWAGSHWVLTIGYHALQSATSNNGLGEIYAIYYADPLPSEDPTTYEAFKWKTYTDWGNYFTAYTNFADPDPATGWYTPPPDHWQNHWVTVERDDKAGYSPDWAMGPSGPITPNYFLNNIYLPLVLKNWDGCVERTEYWYPTGVNTCSPAVSNCAEGDGQPDGVWTAPISVGYHQVEFARQRILEDTNVATYWKTKDYGGKYGHLYIDAKIDGEWKRVRPLSLWQSQDEPGRWEETAINEETSYVGQYLTGLRFGFSYSKFGHQFEVDGYRISNFEYCGE